MVFRALMAAGLVGLGGCRAPQLQPRGLEPAVTTAEALDAALEPRRIALLVGVDAYVDPAFPDLEFAGADATALAEALRSPRGGFDEVIAVGTGSATREEVFAALRQVKATLRGSDSLVVYFAGHGTRVKQGEVWTRYLLVGDSEPSRLAQTAIELGALQSWLSGLEAERKVLVVDACFDGRGRSALQAGLPADPSDGGPAPSTSLMSAGEAHLFATSTGRPSMEDPALGHGVYSWYLLEALSWGFEDADRDQDGVVTAWEAHDHARGRVIDHTEGVQIPEAVMRVVGRSDLVLAGDPAARASREDALVYLYPGRPHPLAGAVVSVDGRRRGVLPGVIVVSPGRHVVTLEDADGERIGEGAIALRQGEALRADLLQRQLRTTRTALAVGPVQVMGAAPILGAHATGLQLSGWWRPRPQRRGQVVGLSAAAFRSSGRPGLDDPRAGGSAMVSGGWQQEQRRVRWRGSWGLGLWWLPPDGPDVGRAELQTIPEQAGWVWFSTGPAVGAALTTKGPWALSLDARAHAARLDLDVDGVPETVGLLSVSAALEAVF